MSESSFWTLQSAGSAKLLARWIENEIDMEIVTCPANPSHRGLARVLSDLSIAIPRRSVADFVCTMYGDVLVRDSVVEMFKIHGFTGWQIKAVKARYDDEDHDAPRLWELVVNGWGGMVRPESGIRLLHQCSTCGNQYYSRATNKDKLVDSLQWDGSDFFMVWPLPGHLFVTESVATAIRAARMRGIKLKRPSELDISGSFAAGRLSYWFPKDRAHELGDPFGIF